MKYNFVILISVLVTLIIVKYVFWCKTSSYINQDTKTIILTNANNIRSEIEKRDRDINIRNIQTWIDTIRSLNVNEPSVIDFIKTIDNYKNDYRNLSTKKNRPMVQNKINAINSILVSSQATQALDPSYVYQDTKDYILSDCDNIIQHLKNPHPWTKINNLYIQNNVDYIRGYRVTAPPVLDFIKTVDASKNDYKKLNVNTLESIRNRINNLPIVPPGQHSTPDVEAQRASVQ